MDFRITPEDRVGTGQARAKAGSSGRVEPTLGGGVGVFVDDERSGGGAPEPAGRPGKARGRKPAKAGPVRGTAKTAGKTAGKAAGKPARKKRGSLFGGLVFGLFYWGFVLCLWAGIGAMGVVLYYGMQLPSSDTWAVPERPPNIRVLAADGRLITNRGQTGGEAVSIGELPYYVPAAIIASEDRRFMSHFGIDVMGLLSVAIESVRAREITRGASTITQQVAKNLFLTPDQTLGRKVQEALLAIWLEQTYTKEEILELYLNRVHFGSGATGIEAAAQIYFGVSARNLTLGQAAMLAGILPSPASYNPRSYPDRALTRQRIALNAMVREGFITAEEAEAATLDPARAPVLATRVAGAEYYVADWVESLMTAYLGDVSEDVVVYTTIDWDLQKHAEFVVREAVATEGRNRGFAQGALVAMETDGTVRALVGGVDYTQSQFNRAVTARRQPGSTFKPFVYIAAMEKGYTPETIAEDAQFEYEGWSPRNATNRYVGLVTLRQGLAYSLNTIAARLAIDVTPQAVIEVATRLGISTRLTPVPSIALGTQEVPLLELTAAYAPLANGGVGVIPNVITRIETRDGVALYEASDAGPGRVLSPDVVAQMNDMLKTAVEVGTGRGASLGGWPFAGKTGTSQDARDALFVGYTARMVTGVWLGNDDNASTTLSGGNIPVAVWSDFMIRAHEGREIAELPGYGMSNSMLVAEQILDPATGQPMIDPMTGQPMVRFVDALTGQQVQMQVDPATGALIPLTAEIDPATGQVITPQWGAAQQPAQPQPTTPFEWNPSGVEATPQQSPTSQRTLMDLIFGN